MCLYIVLLFFCMTAHNIILMPPVMERINSYLLPVRNSWMLWLHCPNESLFQFSGFILFCTLCNSVMLRCCFRARIPWVLVNEECLNGVTWLCKWHKFSCAPWLEYMLHQINVWIKVSCFTVACCKWICSSGNKVRLWDLRLLEQCSRRLGSSGM